MRPVYHQTDERIKAHIFVAALALFLKRTLEHQLASALPEVSGSEKFRVYLSRRLQPARAVARAGLEQPHDSPGVRRQPRRPACGPRSGHHQPEPANPRERALQGPGEPHVVTNSNPGSCFTRTYERN